MTPPETIDPKTFFDPRPGENDIAYRMRMSEALAQIPFAMRMEIRMAWLKNRDGELKSVLADLDAKREEVVALINANTGAIGELELFMGNLQAPEEQFVEFDIERTSG